MVLQNKMSVSVRENSFALFFVHYLFIYLFVHYVPVANLGRHLL